MQKEKNHIIINVSDRGIKPVYKENFAGTIFNSSNYKIYIVKENSKFIYVGKTKQTIGDKFRKSFSIYKKVVNGGKKSSGYSGYKWISEYIDSKREIDLYVFDLGFDDDNEHAEAIEAEIVFLIRKKGTWPEFQNEIHFNNKFKNAPLKAEEIYKKI